MKKGEDITLYVASVGEAYPDFTDGTYTVIDVEEFCEDNGINLKINYVASESIDGTILKQSREAGSPVKEGATFTITVSKNEEIEDSNEDDPNREECVDGLC